MKHLNQNWVRRKASPGFYKVYTESELVSNNFTLKRNSCIFEKNLQRMKNSASLIILSLVFGIYSCQKPSEISKKTTYEVVGKAEVVPGNYGDLIEENVVITSAELVSKIESEGTFSGKISGEIKEVCTKKGCWFSMDLPNGESMRVTFKDYGFFVPTNSQGFPIVMEGVAKLTQTDVETLRHYAEDQGKSKEEVEAITETKREITFEATGVVIKDKA